MSDSSVEKRASSILIVGASRGLGYQMAAEFLQRGWKVLGTVRGDKTKLHELAADFPRLEIHQLDITSSEEIASLRERLSGYELDILFVNAGTTNSDPAETIGTTSTEEFIRVMFTNALSPLRVIEGLDGLVRPTGMIGVMSSGQGSIANNEKGGREVYRSSKAALNQNIRSYAARHAGEKRSLLVLAPGWIRTALGGADASTSMEEAVPKIVEVLLSQQGIPGLRYLDRDGRSVPW